MWPRQGLHSSFPGQGWPSGFLGASLHLLCVTPFLRCLSTASQTSSTQNGAGPSRSRGFIIFGSKGTLPSHTSVFIPRDQCTSFSTTPTCSASSTSHWWVLQHCLLFSLGSAFLSSLCSESKGGPLVRGRRIRVKVAGTFFGGKELFGLQISSFFFPVSWGSEGRGRPWCAGFCWFDYLPALSLST